ncbi:MAG: MltA domain-containing protein [Sphingorhabdus sp.]
MTGKFFAHISAALLLAGCSSGIIPNGGPATSSGPPPATSTGDKAAQPIPATPNATLPPPTPAGDGSNAAGLGIVRGPQIAAIGISERKARAALASFRTSCPGLMRRVDRSALTLNDEWRPACDAVKSWSGDAVSFFATYMDAVQIGDGKAFATGYFEPEIAGSRIRRSGYEVPVYGRPSDLIDVDLGQFNDDLRGKKVRGRVVGSKLVLYDDRGRIDDAGLSGRAPIIAWAKDPVEFFFLQIQGSGRLRAPDGSIMRIGYASQNGRSYTGIGRLMKKRGLLGPGESSMQGIVSWLRRNPAEGRAIMRENKSYVFFREITGAGPLGAMGYPVVGETSAAADPKFVPLGAPVYLSMDRAEPNGLWVVQDTGGAIKGANRFDTFWGAGARARALAGGMAARGAALLFLPKASVARLGL